MIEEFDESGDGPRLSPTDRDVRRIATITSSITDAYSEQMASLAGRGEVAVEAEWLSWLVALTQALIAVYMLAAVGRIKDPDERAIAEIRVAVTVALREAVEARRGILEVGLVADPKIGPDGHAGGRAHG
jgi:hypothetical protein